MTYKLKSNVQVEKLRPREEKRLGQVPAVKKKTLRDPKMWKA